MMIKFGIDVVVKLVEVFYNLVVMLWFVMEYIVIFFMGDYCV